MTGEQYSSTNSNSGSIISSFSSNDDSLERTRPKRLKVCCSLLYALASRNSIAVTEHLVQYTRLSVVQLNLQSVLRVFSNLEVERGNSAGTRICQHSYPPCI